MHSEDVLLSSCLSMTHHAVRLLYTTLLYTDIPVPTRSAARDRSGSRNKPVQPLGPSTKHQAV